MAVKNTYYAGTQRNVTRTDCSGPVVDLLQNRIPEDVFATHTGAWCGQLQPIHALQGTGFSARSNRYAMTSMEFSIEYQHDSGMLEILGLHKPTLNMLSQFEDL